MSLSNPTNQPAKRGCPGKSAIVHEGHREIHAIAANEDYASLCGMDGDDPHRHVQQQMGEVKRGEKITCPQCRQIWEHARKYRASDFSGKVMR